MNQVQWIRVTPCENIPPREGREAVVGDHVVAIFNLAQSQHSTHLGQSLHDEHPRHDGCAGEMTLKERLVDAHLLNPDDTLARHKLNDPVDE